LYVSGKMTSIEIILAMSRGGKKGNDEGVNLIRHRVRTFVNVTMYPLQQ
jgi:hypothetical protein